MIGLTQKGELAALAPRPLHEMQLIDVAEARGDQQLTFGREAERSCLAGAQVGIQFLAQTGRGLGNVVEDQIAALDARRGRGVEQTRRRQ